ncbi:hypothetical protein ACN42_g5237 [Penicillium freii]|uniref:Uncharacterized protein n=1 Tax=Penicillium freii TaxID=48697 RepID=A0A117NP76_PENFR|nr:hypothetical protein ACN42_g5237 [Penicillium freii]
MAMYSCISDYGESMWQIIRAHPWASIGVGLLLTSVKSLPLMWHARLIVAVLYHSVTKKSDVITAAKHGGQGIFGYIVTSSRSPLYECDINGHKSDSTYFSDLDINRIHLLTRLFKAAGDLSLRPTRKSSKSQKDRPKKMRVLLGGTCCTFRKEVKPYSAYEIHSRVLAWDEKWLYVVSYFVKPGSARKMPKIQASKADHPEKREEVAALAKGMVFTSAITKFVFKEGRKTIRPEDALEEMGLLPEKATSEAVTLANGDMAWTWEQVEKEREAGMRTAQHLIALDDLHDQFEDVSSYPSLGKFGLVGKLF